MTFEVFHRPGPRAETPAVTVTQGGLHLNVAAWSGIGRPADVELMFDSAARVVGVRRAGTDTPGPARFAASALRGGGARITAPEFLAHIGYRMVLVPRVFDAHLVDGALCVELGQPVRLLGGGS
jgi:hypothetical protein